MASARAGGQRTFVTPGCDVFEANDSVVLRSVANLSASPYLILKLDPAKMFQSQRGNLPHSGIIGRHVRDSVQTNLGRKYRVSYPTLAEYLTLRSRRVTPIYPSDASYLTSLLDLHPTAPPLDSPPAPRPPLEILEAGTGHASLTLHLARAIHAANPSPILPSERPPADPLSAIESAQPPSLPPPGLLPDLTPDPRRAIIHTLDCSPDNTHFARHVVHAFRSALYQPSITFHTGSLAHLLALDTAADRFEHILLDLPKPERYLLGAFRAMKVDGLLVVWAPSVTQLISCVRKIKDGSIGLLMETVVELRGGEPREWDLRLVRPREGQQAKFQRETAREGQQAKEDVTGEVEEKSLSVEVDLEPSDGYEMVCRPKVGARLAGGGFVGVWRKARGWFEEGSETDKDAGPRVPKEDVEPKEELDAETPR